MDAVKVRNWVSPVLVGVAAFLWATDALVRYPAIDKIDPTFIVLVEHLIAVFLFLPWLLMKSKKELFSLSFREWLAALFNGMGGSAIATVFFTASFIYINPSVAVLLQKLQPVIVVIIAYFMLGERPARKFYFWGTVAIAAGVVLSFPDLDFSFLSDGMDLRSRGVQFAFGAALLWAGATVSGKYLLKKTAPSVATFWRFFFGLIALLIMQAVAAPIPTWSSMHSTDVIFSLLYLSLVPGLFAILIYYYGLSRTPASVSTFIELVYPIGAVILNTIFLHTPLVPVQTVAGLVLLGAVAMISF